MGYIQKERELVDTSSRQGDGDGLKPGGQGVGDVAKSGQDLAGHHLDVDLLEQHDDFFIFGFEIQVFQIAFPSVFDELVQLDGALDNLPTLFQERVNVLGRGHFLTLRDGRIGGNDQQVAVGFDDHAVAFRVVAVAVMRLTAQGLGDLFRVNAGSEDGAQLDQGDVGTGGAALGDLTNLGQVFFVHCNSSI